MKIMIPIRNDELLRHLEHLLQHTSDDNLRTWLHNELIGYEPEAKLPWYRILECRQKGLFLHHATTRQETCQINERCLGQRDMERVRFLLLRGPLSDYLNNHHKTLERWPESLLHEYSQNLIPEHICLYAWKEPLVCVRDHLLMGIHGLLQEHDGTPACDCGQPRADEQQETETEIETPQRSARHMQHRQWWV